MRYASVCSGVEAASLAWETLGWEPVWFSQFDPEHNYKLGPDFPSAVLAAHWPHVPNLGDMTKLAEHEVYKREKFDLLVGGTPCQDYSIAGLRKGMDGERGQLTLRYVDILEDKQPTWFLWENVPGVLSSSGGRDFATFIHDLKAVGYSFAWRILDAQYCGVPQRRRRIFIVGHLGDDWRPPAAVLFERQSMPGYFKPSGKAEENTAGSTGFSVRATSEGGLKDITMALTASYGRGGADLASKPLLHLQHFDRQSMSQYSEAGVASTINARDWKCPTDLVCIGGQHPNAGIDNNLCQTLTEAMGTGGGHIPLVNAQSTIGALDTQCGFQKATHQSLNAGHVLAPPVTNAVRRLTPVECERLQGMPDHHTNIIWKGKPAPAGQRYKAIGNSMATVAMHWLGKRIDFVDGVINGSI